MPAEHVLTPDDKCPCGKPQTGSGYCSYECYSKHEPEPASMGGPLSEADRLVRARAFAEGEIPDSPDAFRLGREIVRELLAEVKEISRELHAYKRAKAENDERFQLAAATARVGVLEGQLATARAEAVQLNSQLKDPGLDWLIDWAMGTDREARDHYFHINDGEGDSCGCRYADEGALGLDGGDPDA